MIEPEHTQSDVEDREAGSDNLLRYEQIFAQGGRGLDDDDDKDGELGDDDVKDGELGDDDVEDELTSKPLS